MPINVAIILGAIAALACTILVLIFITPEKKKATLNKFFTFLHNLFNFKFLMIETILKVLYIFATTFMIGAGFFLLFAGARYFGHFQSTALSGLLLMIFGPILVRIVYECMMLVILIAKNVIQINSKMSTVKDKEEKHADAPQFGIPESPNMQ